MLITSLLILLALSASFCYDIELEGNMRVGNDLLSIIREYSAIDNPARSSMPLNISTKEKLLNKALNFVFMRSALKLNNTDDNMTDPLQKDVNHLDKGGKPTLKYINNKIKKDLNVDKKGSLISTFKRAALKPNKTDDSLIDILNKYIKYIEKKGIPTLKYISNKMKKGMNIEKNNNLEKALMRAVSKRKKTDDNITDPLQKYVNHLKKKGKDTLKYISDKIKKDMNIDKNNTLMLKAITDDYVFMMQNYYDYVTEDKQQALVDKEYAYLDMIETSWRMLYSEEEKLLDDIIMDGNSSSMNIQTMNKKIYQHSITDKKNEMRYVCYTYDICRQYPAFSDYCANLINEILKLPEEKFEKFLKVLSNILTRNSELFSEILEKEHIVLMTSLLYSIYSDLTGMKEFFVVLRAVINQRFKVMQNGNEKLETRNKAVKILFDIIDKATSLEEDLLAIDFDTSASALKSWSVGVRGNIENIFEEFVKHVLRVLEYNLTNTAKKEMNVLTDIILRGTTQNEKVYKRLFKFGTKFVKSDDMLSDREVF